jgi:hypothetical protein
MREDNQARQAERLARARVSPEAHAAAARAAAPRMLGSETIDPVTGVISWPEALLDEQYASGRAEIEKHFELRAMTSGGASDQQQIRTAISDLQGQLKKNIQKLDARDYLAARRFLDSLARTAALG